MIVQKIKQLFRQRTAKGVSMSVTLEILANLCQLMIYFACHLLKQNVNKVDSFDHFRFCDVICYL